MNNVMSMREHREMENLVELMNVVLEKSYYLQDNVKIVYSLKESCMMQRYARFRLVQIERRLTMKVNASSAMNLKDNRHSVHVDQINAKQERSSFHQVNVKLVKTTPFFQKMVRAASLHNTQLGNSSNSMVRAHNVPITKLSTMI